MQFETHFLFLFMIEDDDDEGIDDDGSSGKKYESVGAFPSAPASSFFPL